MIPRRRTTRTTAAIGTALAGLLVLAPGASAAPSAVGHDPRRSPAVPERYTAQEIAWAPCYPDGPPEGFPAGAERLECGQYVAPLDWDRARAGRDVSIAVSRLRPTTGSAERSVFTNPGGPGAPGLTFPLVYLAAERTRLTESRDIIGIDVRGTGGSTNATCAGAASTLDELDPRARSEANTTLILDVSEAIARTCQDATGDLSPVINTEQTVRDLDLLRDLLDRESIDWIGYSGGTWLGAAYATYFPRRVGAFVLDANTEFTADWQESFAWQPLGFERRFTVDFLPWAARYDDRFGIGSTPEEVRATYEALRAQLAEQPIPLLPGVEVGPVLLDALVTSALYSKAAFSDLADTIAALRDISAELDAAGPVSAQGGGAPVPGATPAPAARPVPAPLRSMLERDPQLAGGELAAAVAPDAFEATFFHITCNDTPWEGDRASLLRESQEQGELYPLRGWYTLGEPCVFWERPRSATLAPRTGRGLQGGQGVLMVQNDKDPATPVEGALAARAAFASARLLLVEDEGDHTVYPGNPCVDEKVEAYLLDGVPAEDSTCPGVGLPEPTPVLVAEDPEAPPEGTPVELNTWYSQVGGR